MNKAAKGNLKSAKRVTSAKHTYVTSRGLSEAQAELEHLRKIKLPEIADKIQQAREYGDLSENSEYDAAIAEQSLTENRINELESVIKSAKVIADNHSSDFVVIGSTVRIQMDGEMDEFTIVGRLEADPAQKRISNESPLGSALLGAKKGEEVEVTTPIVRYKCKVLEVK